MVVPGNNLPEEFSNWLALSDRKTSSIKALLNEFRLLRLNCPNLRLKEVEVYLSSLKSLGKSTSHINNLINVARIYHHFCTENSLPVDDLLSLKFLKDKFRPRATMSDEEIDRLLALPRLANTGKVSHEYWRTFFSIMAYTGMRTGEVSKLKVENIDFAQEVFYLIDTKTNENRIVPIPPNIKELVLNWTNQVKKGYLFYSNRPEGHTSNVEWHYQFRSRVKRLGIKRPNLTPYSLRHSYITEMLQTEGVNLFDVKNLVGHHDTRTTENYYHLTTKRLKNVVKKHPGVRSSTSPQEIFKLIEEYIDSLNLGPQYEVAKSVSSDEMEVSLKFDPTERGSVI